MAELVSINNELTRLSKALATACGLFETAIKEAAERRTTYDVEYAKSLLKAEGSNRETREAEAKLFVKDFMLEARIAEANMTALKERIRAIETVLSVQQSQLRHFEESERVNL